jgi:hypothetical protein
MVCIEKIYSVSALVGDGTCNANCAFCSGKNLRSEAKKEGLLFYRNLEAAIKLSSRYGGWSLSLTGSGEPLCSMDSLCKALEVYDKCAKQGAFFPNVNIFTNGILLGDLDFCDSHLKYLRDLGVTNMAISIHDPDEVEQAKVYGIDKYPKLKTMVANVSRFGIGVRATLLLRKGGIDTSEKYKNAVTTLIEKGFDNITSWTIGNPVATRNEFTPTRLQVFGIKRWIRKNAKNCHQHSWGGGVYDYHDNMLRYTDYVTRHDPKKDYVRQLVVFQDGTVAYSWIREGALCMK